MFKDGNTSKQTFTINHIKSLLVLVFQVDPKKGKRKLDWLDQLEKLARSSDDTDGKMKRALTASVADQIPPLSLPRVDRSPAEVPQPSAVALPPPDEAAVACS